MRIISTSLAPAAIGPYSQAIHVGNLIYTSGQIALKPNGEFLNGDIKEQTTQVLTNLQNVLEEAGSSLQKVIKTTIFLTNMDDFISVNTIYAKFFQNHKPARSTIAVKMLPMNALIEIEAVAIV